MRKHWLGILIVLLWCWTAIFSIIGRWGAVWHLTELWMLCCLIWVLRAIYRFVEAITRPLLQERDK